MNKITQLQDKKEALRELDSHILIIEESIKARTNGIIKDHLSVDYLQNQLNGFQLKALQLSDEINSGTNEVERPTNILNRK